MEDAHGSSGTEPQPVIGEPPPSTVDTTAELIIALNRAEPGDTITLRSQEYRVEVPLLVRDGVTLQGAGVMQPEQGLPVGFQTETKTTITASAGLKGNLLTLSDGSAFRGSFCKARCRLPRPNLSQRMARAAAGTSSPSPHVTWTTVSRQRSRSASSSTRSNQVAGPTGQRGARSSPTRATPNKAPLHEDASVTVTVKRSIVDTPQDGKAVFAMNFASGGKVTIKLKQNVVRGPLDVIGGLSRPDAVVFATTTIDSKENLYLQSQSGADAAWEIVGGSSPPPSVVAGLNSNSDSNSARAESRNDKIKDFRVGIMAIGGRRLSRGGGTCSHNEVKLDLAKLTLATKPPPPPAAAAADFDFEGARSLGSFSPGVGNVVHARVQQTTGSGRRDNHYADGPTGNQLVFVGTRRAFMRSNSIDPDPRAAFFEHGP